ncbi:UNKNOWN [Stylonychia lemnae]|uniref:YHYH domain-containing protein n=1 Tax=Stylonychia lemnae TaxID=5949 RepID=A0A078A6V7_STYLE|nr:UNKNOWN [Stylonychia lemnae]|eukprot:CDW77974.1 UNKNOWN [Stylonychia lemnae]
MTSCPDGSSPPCVWKRKMATVCNTDTTTSSGRLLESSSGAKIRMQTNGLPNHCPEPGASVPKENIIDFEVSFKNKPRNSQKMNRNLASQDEPVNTSLYDGDDQNSVNNALCDGSWTQAGFLKQIDPEYNEYSGNFESIVGIALNGVPIHTGNSEYGSDVFYPKQFGKKVYSGKKISVDKCLGGSEYSGYYHYYAWSPCILPSGPSRNSDSDSCNLIPACKDDALAYSLSFMKNQEKTIMVIGVARDGHSILGPYRKDGMLWQPCDVDLCNGLEIAGIYYYVTTMFHPYTVGCWGPGPKKTVSQECSNNVKVCSYGRILSYALKTFTILSAIYFTIFY